MFKFVLVCALVGVAISSPIPNEVRKTANIQKTSEYYLTAESKPPAPRTTGLTRPSPINPNIQSDPKPQESGKIIPASLTYGEPKSAAQPDAASEEVKPKVQTRVTSSSTPVRTVTEHHAAESTNIESAKVPAPTNIESAKVPAPVSSEHQNNNPTVLRTTQITSYPAAHLDSNPSIASPTSSVKSSQPTIVGVEKKVVKRENSPSKHVEHDNTSDADTSDSDDTSSHHKHNEKQSKPLSSNNDESSYDRDNQPPKYVHPVPVAQIVKNSPPAEIHHHTEEEQ